MRLGLIVLTLLASCHGYDHPATQTLVFRDLPHNADPYPPHHLILRTNFEGSVEFIESPNFLIEVNVESPTIDDLAKVHYNYTEFFGSVMLQMFEAEPVVQPFILSQVPINYILLTLGGATGIAFLMSLIFVCWWNVSKRPLVEALARHKALSPDSSQAPLLEGRPTPEGQTPESNRTKKHRKKPTNPLSPGDEYVSSEDDIVEGRTLHSDSPRKHYTTIPARNPQQAATDMDLYATIRKDPYQTSVTSEGMGSDTTGTPVGSQVDVPSGKPVVSYIKIQGGQDGGDNTVARQKLGQTQYIPLNKDGSLDRYTDLDKQATLKVRRGDSYDDTMPDVVKSRTIPQHPAQAPQRPIDTMARRGVETSRYVPLKTEKESDYSTVNKQLTGAQIAHLLGGDRKGGSPKFTHNTDRPPTSFIAHRDDLDSVGSSRSGESNSGTRTQVSSPFSHATDSDSTKSTSSVPRGRDGAPLDQAQKFILQQPPPGRFGHGAPGGATDHSSDSGHGGSNPRLVDEAYGTMGSNNNTNTLRSSSTASTGSGSSGSVVTVVAADGDGRRKYFRSPDGKNEGAYGTSPRGGNGGGGGGSMGRGPHKYLQASIICAICLISVSTGVYSQMNTQTKVHFKVYAPPGFLKYKTQVFYKIGINVNITTQYQLQGLDFDQFEVKDARIYDMSHDKCSRSCDHGCDQNTGACVCRIGFRLQAGHECIDIDECRENLHDCTSKAKCDNYEGSYKCDCKSGYYGEDNVCFSCREPCRNGTFELMACDNLHPKMCKECSKSCMENYYISTPCTSNNDIICQPCAEKCSSKNYEFTPCVGVQNRQCEGIDGLPRPQMSKNLIYEDQRSVKNVLSRVTHQNYRDHPLTHPTSIDRGTGFSVQINLKESNLAPLYRSMMHKDSNDNADLGDAGLEHVKDTYCNYPVPEKYKLTHNLHRSVTTKAKFHSCSKRKRQDKDKCDKLTGYYLDPKENCLTSDDEPMGNLPSLDKRGRSILCTTAGKLTSIFGVGTELNEMTMMFVDKTKSCMEGRSQCDSCTQTCAKNMQNHRGSNPCNITGEDADNGESPRLANCYSCSAKDDCSEPCNVYRQAECAQERCVVGNLAEFVLEAEFEARRTIFGCNVEPVPGYKIYDIEYSVIYKTNIVNERRLRAVKYYEKGHPDKAMDMHNFLKVYYGSDVTVMPDLVQGDTGLETFSAGFYQALGTELKDADIKSSSVYVRPKRPFSVSTASWQKEDCNTDLLSELIVMTSSSRENDLFRLEPNIRVVPVTPLQYRFFNRTGEDNKAHSPFIYYEIRSDASILKAVYNDTTVKDDGSLRAELLRQTNQWQLRVKGDLSICPGYFGIKVMDPGYTRTPLFHYDIGVNCPQNFDITFFIPTEGIDNYDKKLLVEISDSFRKIKLTVFRPAPNETAEAKDSPVQYTHKGEKEMTIFTPFIAVLCVIISFLILLLFVGFITERGKKPKKCENKVHSQHLLFVVCYVTFRAGYSIVVTFTVLLLLIRHVNRDSMTTLTEFSRYAETAENDQRLEIDHIQSYVMDELRRQNNIANDTKFVCEKKLSELQNVLEDQKQQMRVENNEERLVSQVALQYTKLMILNLTHSISKFREEFTAYSKVAIDRLERNVVQTSSALHSNKWLEGAKMIHNAVQSKRSAQGQSTKAFEDWAGIRQEVESLAVDLSLENFPMPNLTEFLNIDNPKTNNKQSSIPRISEINLPQNKWYYQFEKKASVGAAGSLRPKRPKLKVSSDDIISWSSLLSILVVIDLIWFVHRMAKTYSTAKMILYGCPSFVDCRKNSDPSRKPTAKRSVSSRCFQCIKDFNLRVMKTEFVPKVVATATSCCVVYLILASSDQLLTVKTLASVGYFESMVAPVETSYRLAKTRVKTNSYRINKFEYPFYEELVNVRTKRYQLMLDMYAELQKSNNLLHDSEYCSWKKLLHPEEPCNCTFAQAEKLKFDGCELPPVTPHAYQKKDFGAYRDQLSRTIVPYVNGCRQLVMDTCHIIMIFVTILVLVDSLGAVTWIYLKKFNLLRLKPMFEIEQYPAPELMGNHT